MDSASLKHRLSPMLYPSLWGLLALVLAAPSRAVDVGPTVPSPAQTERARQAIPSATAIDQARASVQVPQVRVPAQTEAPRPVVELDALLRDHRNRARGASAPGSGDNSPREVSGVLFFVTLGMSQASLDRIVDDAALLKAPLVLRGLHEGSMRATKIRIVQLMGKRRVAWQIDPTLYARFDVHAAPTLVLIDPTRPVAVQCNTSQCQAPTFAKVAGDVTAAYALSLIAERDGSHTGAAHKALQALKEKR